ncbi:type II secretion system protein GspM [Paenibacillus spiritus]|uniref:type II secretion system protein GspM n=1 Tax=Paenibacillus spiritus TaxID=2496557 RepID=UPI00168BEFC6|nr:type II secretion system protein GspM [Paenibacillus spiritus]
MEQINKYRSPIVLGILVLFLALLAFYLLGARPLSEKIDQQQEELALLNQQNSLMEKKIDERKADGSADSEKAELLAQLPKGDNAETLILQLRQIELHTGARLKDIGFAVSEQNPIQVMKGTSVPEYPTVKQLTMTAVVEGNYLSVSRWLYELYTMDRIVNVDSLSFQKNTANGTSAAESGILTANVTFSAYFEESDEPTGPAQSLPQADRGGTTDTAQAEAQGTTGS